MYLFQFRVNYEMNDFSDGRLLCIPVEVSTSFDLCLCFYFSLKGTVLGAIVITNNGSV